MNSTPSRLKFDRDDTTGVLTLIRSDRGNAIDLEFGAELLAAAIEIASAPIQALIVRSDGPHFCFGGDLREMAALQNASRQAYLLKLTSYVHTAVTYLASAPCIIIAAVVGSAAGAGFGLVLASDLVIAGRSASFIPAFGAVGLTPDTAVSYFLPQLVGRRRAAELLLTNRSLTADEALAWGVVNHVVDDAEVLDGAESMARRIAAGPREALAATKRLLSGSTSNLHEHLARESSTIAAQGMSREAEEGIDAFLRKRTAQFSPVPRRSTSA